MTSTGGTDEFENASLFEMQNMIANAKPTDIIDRGYHLMAAAEEFGHIAASLSKYTQDVEWQGEGADAFRDWTHQFAKDTVSLTEYTRAVSVHVIEAGAALALAKSTMPPLPSDATLCYTDPTKEAHAQASLEAARQEAIPVMNSLSSTYRVTAESLNTLTPPTFKPLPGSVTDLIGARAGESQRAFNAAAEGSAGSRNPHTLVTESDASRPPIDPKPKLAEAARTNLDAGPAVPGAYRNVTGSADILKTRTAGRDLKAAVLPPGGSTQDSQNFGISGGERLRAAESGVKDSLPNVSLGDEGIVGGIPIRTGKISSQQPRGVVIGEESAVAGATGAKGPYPNISPRSFPGGEGESSGTSFAGESWGAGSDQVVSTAGNPAQSSNETRSVGPNGFPGGPGAAIGPGRSTRGKRPDYLVEDEETWKSSRNIVPPIIG